MKPKISNTRPHPHFFHNLNGYDAHLFIKKLGKRFSKKDIAVLTENKDKYISFNVEINVKLAGVSNKDGREMCKNIQIYHQKMCSTVGFIGRVPVIKTINMQRKFGISGRKRL